MLKILKTVMSKFRTRGYALQAVVIAVCLVATSARAGITFTNIFTFNGTNGSTPAGTLVQGRDGNLYGVMGTGGPYPEMGGFGGVFRIGLDGNFTNLAWFDGTNGFNPNQGLVEGPEGNFYGTTLFGGPSGVVDSHGTAYKITPQGVLTTLVNFDGTNGGIPKCSLVLAPDGNLYGTTSQSGTGQGLFSPGGGTIFRIGTNGSFASVFNFDSANQKGFSPQSGLTLGPDGWLYGTTSGGGTITNQFGQGQGAVFKMSLQGDVIFFGSFDHTNAVGMLWPLVPGADGSFYGTSMYGGTNAYYYGPNQGTFFQVGVDGSIRTLFSFDGAQGSVPRGILHCSDGNFYGVSGNGDVGWTPAGASGLGNIFKLTPDGQYTVLFSFNGTNGALPFCGLMQASDGNLYGTTRGDSGTYGTIFRLSVPMPAAFKSITQTNGVAALTWSAVASQTYQVQYRTNPISGDWTNLGGAITATNGLMSTLDNDGSDASRLYRIVLIP